MFAENKNRKIKIMKTTFIKYGKVLSVIQEENGCNKVFMDKIGNLKNIVSDLECFSIQLSLSKLNKTLKTIKDLGFDVEVDNDYGFDFECRIYCNLKY